MSASTSFDASISGSAAAADVSTPPTPSSPSSSTDAAAAAAARREARKARILGKGSDRLAKLTKQARGDEAEMLYPSTPPPAAAAAAASPAQSKSALTMTAATGEEDPEEIDISNQARMDDEMQRAMQMFQQRQQQGQTQGSPMPQDPFAQMMAALTGGGGGGGGMGGMGGPPGQDGMNGGGMPDLSQLFAAMQQQQPGTGGNGAGVPPGFPGAPGATKVSPASWLSTRLFSLLHTLVFLALGYFAIASALGGGTSTPASTQADEFGVDDAAASAVLGTGHNEASQRLHSWASLAYYRPSTASSGLSSGLQSRHFDIDGASLGVKGALPLFHLFLLIEVLLQSVRFLFSSPLSSHPQSQQQMAGGSPLSMLLQFLPPPIRFAVVTGKRWLSLLGTCVDDIAVLVFALGCGTIWCAAQVKA